MNDSEVCYNFIDLFNLNEHKLDDIIKYIKNIELCVIPVLHFVFNNQIITNNINIGILNCLRKFDIHIHIPQT